MHGRLPESWVAAGLPGLLSIVIPAHNEAENLEPTVSALVAALGVARINYEILIVNDNSTDDSSAIISNLAKRYTEVREIQNPPPNGFGFAVRAGLEAFRGDVVAIIMADGSDDPADVVKCYRKLGEGYDCVFGSRFISGSRVVDYPFPKLILNRMANLFIRLLFRQRFNDFTNAFKIYRREVIVGVQPILSHHFNLTVELPLKALVRGYTFGVAPISWRNRKQGTSKLKIQEMGSRYLFIVLYCLLEAKLSRGDYRRPSADVSERGASLTSSV
jgi:dolichol-phosphate mannosyltransferase